MCFFFNAWLIFFIIVIIIAIIIIIVIIIIIIIINSKISVRWNFYMLSTGREVLIGKKLCLMSWVWPEFKGQVPYSRPRAQLLSYSTNQPRLDNSFFPSQIQKLGERGRKKGYNAHKAYCWRHLPLLYLWIVKNFTFNGHSCLNPIIFNP